jgi:Vacuolar protein sorting-associated protein 35
MLATLSWRCKGTIRDRERREVERQQLADLVGKNLTYVSQLDGLDFMLYKEAVLPRVMEQIISCKDDIAQQYLMQCLIQVATPHPLAPTCCGPTFSAVDRQLLEPTRALCMAGGAA